MAKTSNLLGSWIFLIGVLLALTFGVLSALGIVDLTQTVMASVMVVIGLIVGLFNVTGGESLPFLVSGIALIIASVFGAGIMMQIPVISDTLNALLLIFVPATIIVAVKNVFSLSHK